jgi:hypothetical protein
MRRNKNKESFTVSLHIIIIVVVVFIIIVTQSLLWTSSVIFGDAAREVGLLNKFLKNSILT